MYSGMATSAVPTLITGGSNNSDGFLGGSGIGGILIGALLGGGLFGGIGGRGGYGMDGGAARSAVATDITLSPALTAIQNQVTGLSSQITTQGLSNELESIETTMNGGLLSILGGIKDNANLYLTGTGQLLQGQASNNFQTLSSLNGAVSTITAQNYNAALQQLNSFNQLNTTTLQSFNENSRDNANSFNAIQATLQAQNAQQANCCCEIKQAINASTQSITDLITSNRIADLTAQLNDAKNSISDLNQTNQLIANNALQTSTILQHLRPLFTTSTSAVV